MNKEQIVDYVMNTPNNTNKMILRQMLDTYSEQNGVQADWNQNDETAKNYIKNRTHYSKIEEQIFFNKIINFNSDASEEEYGKQGKIRYCYYYEEESNISYNSDEIYVFTIGNDNYTIENTPFEFGNKFLYDDSYEDDGGLYFIDQYRIYLRKNSADLSFKITKLVENIIPIPEKYFPSDLFKYDLILEWRGTNDPTNVDSMFSLGRFSVISGETDKVMTKLGNGEITKIIMLGERRYESEQIYTSYLPVQSVYQLNGILGLTFLLPRNEYTLDTYYMVNIKINEDSNKITGITYKTLQYA